MNKTFMTLMALVSLSLASSVFAADTSVTVLLMVQSHPEFYNKQVRLEQLFNDALRKIPNVVMTKGQHPDAEIHVSWMNNRDNTIFGIQFYDYYLPFRYISEVLKTPVIWHEGGLDAQEEGGMTANIGNDRLARDIAEVVAAFDLRCVQKVVGEKSQTLKELFPETLKELEAPQPTPPRAANL
jgi:hypothetical protein